MVFTSTIFLFLFLPVALLLFYAVPAAPGAPSAVAASTTSITVTWSNVAGEDGYRIERSLNQGTGFAQVVLVRRTFTPPPRPVVEDDPDLGERPGDAADQPEPDPHDHRRDGGTGIAG